MRIGNFIAMKPFLFAIAFLSSLLLNSQNLVPNPSFEDTVQFDGQPGLDTWLNNIGTPDYFSAHFLPPFDNRDPANNFRGGEKAQDGDAVFGFAVLDGTRLGRNFREYMQTELLDTMVKDGEYQIEFFISLADSFHLAVNEKDIGIYLSNAAEPNNFDHEVREFRPFFTSDSAWNASNKNGWEKFTYNHVAAGGEKALIIGCFKTNAEVSVDTVGNGGDSFLAKKGAYYFIDNISVVRTDSSVSLKETPLINQIKLFPNPVKEQLQLQYSGQQTLNFQLINLQGQLISIEFEKNAQHYRFATAHLPPGIYFLQISDGLRQSSLKVVKE